jgi:hypothetical protein
MDVVRDQSRFAAPLYPRRAAAEKESAGSVRRGRNGRQHRLMSTPHLLALRRP